jgi:ketosteroid isomerase-like protein
MTDAARDAISVDVREAVDEYFSALNAHDVERVFASYLQTENFAYLGVTNILAGWDAFSRTVANWFRNRPDITFEYEIALIQVLSPAVAVASVHASSTEQEWLLFTQVYVSNDAGRWVIAHEHVSWPGAEAPREHPSVAAPQMPDSIP